MASKGNDFEDRLQAGISVVLISVGVVILVEGALLLKARELTYIKDETAWIEAWLESRRTPTLIANPNDTPSNAEHTEQG